MRTKQRWMGALLIALLATLAGTGCSAFSRIGGTLGGIFSPNRHNDFAEANLRIKAKEQKYTEQRLVVVDAGGKPRDGILTAAQYRKFQALEQNVIDATEPTYQDVLTWRKTNTKPADYEAHERTLFAAVDELVTYIKREAVKP